MADNWDNIQQAELEREDFDRGYPRDDDRNLPGSVRRYPSPCQYLGRADTMETGLCFDPRLSGSAFCQRHFNAYWRIPVAAITQAEIDDLIPCDCNAAETMAMPMRSDGQLVLL